MVVRVYRSSKYKFMQDGAPVHTSRSTRSWLQAKGVRMFNAGSWPANSPDMNPIEHVWPMLGRKLIGQIFANRDALWAALVKACAEIDPHTIIKLYDSMPRRLLALRKARGGPTRY